MGWSLVGLDLFPCWFRRTCFSFGFWSPKVTGSFCDVFWCHFFASYTTSASESELIREYKAVTGKCRDCSELSILRSSFRDSNRRQETTRLHSFHRATYMGERASYYRRRGDAKENPRKYCSIITDGMAQSHTILPWLKNLDSFSHTIDQHLQGVIQHGQWINIYRYS